MLYLAIVSIIWAFSFGIIGSSLKGVDSYLVATLRLASASLVFLPFLRPKYIQGIDGLRLFFYGFIQFGLMYVCYMKAYQYLPSHLVALFSIFTPIYVVVINDIRKRQFSVQYLMAALLSIGGAAVIKVQDIEINSCNTFFLLSSRGKCVYSLENINLSPPSPHHH